MYDMSGYSGSGGGGAALRGGGNTDNELFFLRDENERLLAVVALRDADAETLSETLAIREEVLTRIEGTIREMARGDPSVAPSQLAKDLIASRIAQSESARRLRLGARAELDLRTGIDRRDRRVDDLKTELKRLRDGELPVLAPLQFAEPGGPALDDILNDDVLSNDGGDNGAGAGHGGHGGGADNESGGGGGGLINAAWVRDLRGKVATQRARLLIVEREMAQLVSDGYTPPVSTTSGGHTRLDVDVRSLYRDVELSAAREKAVRGELLRVASSELSLKRELDEINAGRGTTEGNNGKSSSSTATRGRRSKRGRRRGRGGSAGANTSAGSGRNRSLSSRAGAGGHGGVGQEEVSQALHGEYSVFPGTGGNDGDSRMFGDTLLGGVMPMDEMERDQLVASYMVSTKEAQAERDSLAEQLRSVLVQLHTLQDLQDQHAGGGGGNRGDREGGVGYGEQGGQHGQYGGPQHSGSRGEGVGGGGPWDAKDDEIRRLRTQLATAEDGLVAAQRMTVTSLADDMEASMRGDADTADTASSSSSRGRRRGRGGLSRSPGGTRRRGASSTSVSPRRGRTGLAGSSSSSSSSSSSTSGPSYARNTATSMRRRRGSASSTDTHLQLGEDEQGKEREREMRRLEQDLAEARLRLVASSDEADRLRNDFHNARAEADAAEAARAEAAAMLSDAAAANEAKAATAAEVDPAGPSDKTPLSGDERRRYSEQVSLLQSRVGAVEAANAQLKAKLILTPHRGTRGGARGSGGGGNISSLSSLNASAAGDGSAAATLRRELAGVRQRLVVAEESLEEARGRAEEAEAVARTEVDAAHDTVHYEREALGRLRASSQQAQVALQNAQATAGAQKGVTDELRAQLETMVATNKELAGRTHEHAQQTTEAVSSLRKEVLDGTAEVEALLLRESELEETIVALRAQVAHHEQMEAQLFERLTSIKDKPALPDTARAAAHEVVRLETLLSGKERTLAKMTATVEHLKDRLSAETKRHGDEHGKVQQSLDDLEALKERLRGDTSSAAELAVLRSDKNRLDLKVSELESKHRALQSNIDQRREQHGGEVARWEARVSESIQENTRLRSRADVLEIRLRTAQATSGSGSGLGSGSNAGGGNGAADMTAHLERNDRADRAGRGARGGSDASREANREAEEEEERQRRREEKDLQDAQMEELRSSMDRLERALGEARLLSDAKGRRVEELVQRSDASEGRASRAEGRVREMQDALDAAREDAGRLRGANDVLRSEVASTKTQMKDASSSAGRIRDMDTTIAGQREGAAEHARAAAVRQIAALEESLEETRTAAEASRVECRELRAQLVEVQRQHEEEERARDVERQREEDREREREQDRDRERGDTRGARRSGSVASASAEHVEEVEEDLNRTRASLAAVQSRADERDEQHAATVRTMEQQVMVLRQQLLAAREALGESRQREEEAHAADAGGNVTAVGGEGRLADMGPASAGDDNTVSGVWATPGPLRGGTGTLGGGAGAGDLTQGGTLDGDTSLVATQGTGQAAEVEEGLRRAERRMESLEAELRSAREEGDLLRDRLASKDAELREAAEAAEGAEGGAEAGEKEKAGGKKGGDKAKSGRSSGKVGGKSGKTKGGKRVGGKKGSLVPASSLPHGGSAGEVARLREAMREHSARSSKAEEEAKKLKIKLKAAEADAKSARADRSRKAELLGKAKLDRQQDDDAVQACREELQGAIRRATRAEETSARRETLLCDLRERLARAEASVVEERKTADAQRSKEVSEVRTRGDAQKRSSVEGLRRQVEAFKAKVADLEGQKETIQRQGDALKRLKMELQVKNTERMIWQMDRIK